MLESRGDTAFGEDSLLEGIFMDQGTAMADRVIDLMKFFVPKAF